MKRELFIDYSYIVIALLFIGSIILANVSARQAIDKTLTFSAEQSAVSLSRSLQAFRQLYSKEVINKLANSQFTVTHQYQGINNAIPLPASLTLQLGEHIGQIANNVSVSLYSPYPFSWRQNKGGLKDNFQKNAWQHLTQYPQEPYYRIETQHGKSVIRHAVADRMQASCVTCHNHHPDTPKADWEIGDVRGILEITMPLDTIVAEGQKQLTQTQWLNIASAFTGLLAIALVVFSFRLKLKQQQDLQYHLEQRNHELEQFSYRATHDLKAPLTTSKRLSEFIIKDIDAHKLEEAKKNTWHIHSQMENLENLVIDILSLSRSALSEKASAINFDDILQETKERLSLLIEESNCYLQINIDSYDTLKGERIRYAQIIENILSNSFKYYNPHREDRWVKLTITNGRNHLLMRFEDNGIGIPEDKLHKLFDMFTRFHPKKAAGSGLGMAIVKKHIDHMAGTIDVKSSTEGTVFIIQIPIEGDR